MENQTVLTPAWVADAVEMAHEDAAFQRAARSLTTTLYLYEEDAGTTIRFHQGKVAEIIGGRGQAILIELGGTRAQWKLALAEAVDLDAATVPAMGGLAFQGDHVHRAGNAVALQRLWTAMRRASGVDVVGTRPDAVQPSSVHEITGRYVDVLGYRTYYESAGTGRPVVCLHTGGADGREYRHLLPQLAALGYRGIALDLPGHGKWYPDLDTLGLLRTTEEWIDFVLGFSWRLGLERPVYIGCAMTGSLLLQLAARHPEAASAIVSVNGTVAFVGVLGENFLDVLNHPQVNIADFFESVTRRLLGENLPTAAENECLWHNARNLTPEVMYADMAMYDTHDVRGALTAISVPVLHLRGEFDPVSPEVIEAIRTGIRQVTLVELPGVGHIPMLEDPTAFNRAVERFLRGLGTTEN